MIDELISVAVVENVIDELIAVAVAVAVAEGEDWQLVTVTSDVASSAASQVSPAVPSGIVTVSPSREVSNGLSIINVRVE